MMPLKTLLMFDLGLSLRVEDFGKVFRQPLPLAIALFGQIVLLPAIALGLAWAFRLTPVFFIGLILIACCPGGSSSNVFSKLAGGDVALSVTLTALSSVITLFTIPLIMTWATDLVGESVGISLPVGNLIKQNLLLMLLPVILGIAMHYAWPAAATAKSKCCVTLARFVRGESGRKSFDHGKQCSFMAEAGREVLHHCRSGDIHAHSSRAGARAGE